MKLLKYALTVTVVWPLFLVAAGFIIGSGVRWFHYGYQFAINLWP